MSRLLLTLATLLVLATTARADAPLVAIDLLRTHAGEQSDYLRFIERNWAAVRAEALRRGFVSGYEVLVREPDGEQWDVMLRTTYPDADAHARREANFAALFENPRFAMKRIDGKGPRDMAEFIGDGRPARTLLSAPGSALDCE